MTDAPTTTGRRTWRLIGALALPWVVCGGLLWAVVGLTPTPQDGGVQGGVQEAARDRTQELSATLVSSPDFFNSKHPVSLFAVWNERGDERALAAAISRSEVAGVIWTVDGCSFIVVSMWWLLPFPLLWSGFNLWRWVRRNGD